LTAGSTRKPALDRFCEGKPAANITLGLLVLVQLVIAAIRTLRDRFRLQP